MELTNTKKRVPEPIPKLGSAQRKEIFAWAHVLQHAPMPRVVRHQASAHGRRVSSLRNHARHRCCTRLCNPTHCRMHLRGWDWVIKGERRQRAVAGGCRPSLSASMLAIAMMVRFHWCLWFDDSTIRSEESIEGGGWAAGAGNLAWGVRYEWAKRE